MAGADRQQQHAGATDAASDFTDLSGSGMATVVLDTGHEQQATGRVVLATAADASSIPDSRTKQQGKASTAAADSIKGRSADTTAAAGSVAVAALQVASSKAAPPQHLTLYRLTAEANRNLTGQEKKEKGALSLHVLKWYIGAAGGILVALGVLGVIIIEQASRVLTDTFLGWWAADVFHQGLWFYIGLYAGLGVLYSLLTFVR
jgi:ATP-binding cassette subfamily C (CFTR/MRP) protein 1